MLISLTQFKKDVDLIIKKGRNKDEAIFQVLKKYILESEKVLFEGEVIVLNGIRKLRKEAFPILQVFLNQ